MEEKVTKKTYKIPNTFVEKDLLSYYNTVSCIYCIMSVLGPSGKDPDLVP